MYFKEGKADISKREAVLFDKNDYVFDIYKKDGMSEEEKMLFAIEAEELKMDKTLDDEKKEKLHKLDLEWESIVDDINTKLKAFTDILDGRDSNLVLTAKLENKPTLLYSLMEEYPRAVAQKIMEMADYVSLELSKLAELQSTAIKL